MNLLVNKDVKVLFYRILACIGTFVLIALMVLFLELPALSVIIIVCAIGMALAIVFVCFLYLKTQQRIMEEATTVITNYIAEDHDARIACNEEGELYRLFHEVNSLAAILNARVEDENRSRQFLKDTISNISHQLKTPLAALNIYNGILQGEAEEIPEIQEFTTLSEQELDRIDTLVQNLLKIARLDAGAVVMKKEAEHVADLCECVKQHFSYRADQEKKTIELSGEASVSLLCDRIWMIEALDNIVKNAMDHTKEGNHIGIEWKQFASVVQIRITDDGSGIHPEDLHFIFRRFYRSKYSMDTQGIGLGLPLSKMIIEEHNGTVEVDSELGVGTTFVLNFLIPTEL